MSNISNLKELAGSLCEVLTKDNRMLFAGVIQSYDPATGQIQVDLYRGEGTPQGVVYETEVKLRVYSPKDADQVALLYASVIRCARDYWILEFRHIVSCTERRESFRCHVSASATVRHTVGPDAGMEHLCQLGDISVTGVLFHCKSVFAIGDILELSFPPLRPGGSPYVLLCVVRRILDDSNYSYGCEFRALPPRVEQQLYQDLFALQSQAISRRPKR